MQTLPIISVVTVTFNAAQVVEKTIRSVVCQTYDQLEYLIIDGGSTDDTMAIVNCYKDRIAYIVSEKDKGLYDAMNKGVAAATGDYVIMLNADDEFIDERVVADVAGFIAAHPDCDAVFGNTEQVWEYGTYIGAPTEAYQNHKMCISPQATFTRTGLMRAHPFDLRYRYAADFEQFTSMCLEGRTFLHFDRVISRVELRTGVTHDNALASANEIYDIIASQGFDIEQERRKILRHKRMVNWFKHRVPRWISRPILSLIAKVYKPL